MFVFNLHPYEFYDLVKPCIAGGPKSGPPRTLVHNSIKYTDRLLDFFTAAVILIVKKMTGVIIKTHVVIKFDAQAYSKRYKSKHIATR